MTTSLLSSPDTTIRQTILASIRGRGWNQRDLAGIAGLSPAFVSDIIGGRRRVGPATALRLEAALGTPCATWLELQREADQREQIDDLRRLRLEMADELAGIARSGGGRG